MMLLFPGELLLTAADGELSDVSMVKQATTPQNCLVYRWLYLKLEIKILSDVYKQLRYEKKLKNSHIK